MGATSKTIEAKTKAALKQKVRAWEREIEADPNFFVQLGYDEERVQKTPAGYKIYVRAHT